MWNPFSRSPRPNRRRNNGQSPIVEPEDRLGSLEDVAGAGTAPIVSVSVGTTGLNRAKRYHRHMDALGVADRIQSMLIYDCNQFNINQLKEESAAAGIDDKIVLPEYLPFSEGFLRRVDQYEKHYGAIERDMENMVEKMEHMSLSAGTEPQIILEWVGFGGHAMLSYMFHDIVVKRFPEASILPIVCFPDDRGMHQNIREHHIWEQTMEILKDRTKEPSRPYATLLTDNRKSTDFRRLDESLIAGLASVEGCFDYEPSFGSLAEVISVFNITGSRWITIENTEVSMLNRKALGRKAGRQSQDKESQKVALSKMAQKIKERIFEIAQPENRFQKSAFFSPGTRENEQRIYVTIPLYKEEVMTIRDDLEDQFKREEFSKAFPGTQIAYAAGNLQTTTPENREYAHVIKFVGLEEEPEPLSISSIIYDQPLPDEVRQQGHRSVKTRGQIIIDGINRNGTSGDQTEDPSPDDSPTGAGSDDPDNRGSETAPGNTDPTDDPSAQNEMDDSVAETSNAADTNAGGDDATDRETPPDHGEAERRPGTRWPGTETPPDHGETDAADDNVTPDPANPDGNAGNPNPTRD